MASELTIDGYRFSVDDRRLVIEKSDAGSAQLVNAVFTPAEANQLSVLLNKLVPDEYGVRSDFRIPINANTGLTADVLVDDRRLSVIPKCLSLSGMFAAAPQNEPIAKTGVEVLAALAFRDLKLEIPSIVTRSNTTGLGLAFVDATDDGISSDRLTRLVMAIQREWIAKNAV